MVMPWLGSLNDRQREAATAGVEPLLILAGAGTGKTNTLAHRVAHLIHTGTPPARILLLAFTRRAAAEMLRRVHGLLSGAGVGDRGTPAASRVWGGTFHATANRLLRFHAPSIGLHPSFTVLDRSDAENLLDSVRSELGLHRADRRFPRKGTCLAVYSRCVNAQEPVADAVASYFPWCAGTEEGLKALFKAYVAQKQEQNVLDYDDLLLYWFHLLQEEVIAQELRRRFDAVLVDEYQDTNALQAEILHRLRPDGRGLTVVGDDAQSIYSFRAATVDNILGFPRVYPGARMVTLEENYRSVQPILDAANAVIAESGRRFEKNLFSGRTSDQKPRLVHLLDEDQQSAYLIGRILEHREAGIALRKQAVLFRAAHHSDALEVELARRQIPFVKYGGLKFLEAAHVKDALCILRVAENPRDVTSAFRVLQLLDGIGPAHARRALTHLAGAGHDPAAWESFRPPPAAAEQWPRLTELLRRLRREPPEAAPALPDQVAWVRTFYEPILERRYDQAAVRARDLEQLEGLAAGFRSRADLLADLTLDPPHSTQDLAGPPLRDEDYLILSTIHSAKGCEWDVVYVIHAADGNIPSDMATGTDDQIEEERRLFYVALTRAKDFLEVCVPLRYYHKKWATGDRHSWAQVTRFLPREITHHFESARLAEPATEPQPAPDAAERLADIRRRIGAMWD